MKLTFFYFSIKFVLPQDLQNAAHVGDVLKERFREDDDVIDDAHGDEVHVLFENVVHEMLEHGWCIGRSLRAYLILEVPLLASERRFPFIPLLDPDLVVCIFEVNLCEDPDFVEAVQHLRYEGEGVAVFYRYLV